MLSRQALLRGPRLNRLSPSPLLALRIHGPPIRPPRPAEVGRRWLASVVSTSPATFTDQWANQQQQPDEIPDARPTPLDHLLRAIQCRDAPAVVPAFLNWVVSLIDESDSGAAALQELSELPVATFSEILRWIDPVANSKNDLAHGLHISLGQVQFTNAGQLIDEYGVRRQHRGVLDAVKVLLDARINTGHQLLVADYEVLLRCAGAASDPKAAIDFFGAIAKNGQQAKRNTATWNEFLKARFLIDPIYYQFDRSRVCVLARQTYSTRQPYHPDKLWRMERMRLSMSALRALPFNRSPQRPSQDLRMWLRKKNGFMGIRRHWIRSKLYGVHLDEELLCISMVAFARASSLALIRGICFRRGYRINFMEDATTGEVLVKGGKNFREGSPRKPTVRLLDAIVESFGCMSRITTGTKLLVYVSLRYNIPIPHATWSNLLNWAYVCSSKPFRPQRRLQGDHKVHVVTAGDIRTIWGYMTSKQFSVKPTFDDYSVYVKALILTRSFREALDIIRTSAIPYYRSLEQAHQQIVFDEVLRELPEPSHRRIQIETRKEHVWYHIAGWMTKLLDAASKNKNHRGGAFMQVEVPNLVAEFGEFMHDQVRYRTAQGYVRLEREPPVRRFDWVREIRETLRQELGGMVIRNHERDEGDDGLHPEHLAPEQSMVRTMRVLEWKRKPRPKTRALGPPPESTDVNVREWWNKLEEELMT
ncbi:hypothetical protein ACJ41O_000636 [Fusarium nematophilum]